MSVRDRFYSKNRDLSMSDHVCGSESCQEQRRLLRTSEKELMLLIWLEKVTKPSLKSLTPQIHSQTDCVQMEEIQDHCYLPEKWSTNKDHSKAERVIVCEVAKVPRETSKQLKVFLTLHLSDAFIQSDLHCIQVTVLHFISSCFPWESNPWSWRC